MTSDTLIRAAAPAAIVAALIGIPADIYHFTIDSRASAADSVLFKLHGLALVLAFTLTLVTLGGIALRLGDRLGRLGTAGVVLAFAGTILVLINIGTEAFSMGLAPDVLDDPTGYALVVIIVSFAVFSVGWILLGVVAGRSGLVPVPAAALLCLGAVIGFTPIAGAYILLLAGIASTAQALASDVQPSSARVAFESLATTRS